MEGILVEVRNFTVYFQLVRHGRGLSCHTRILITGN